VRAGWLLATTLVVALAAPAAADDLSTSTTPGPATFTPPSKKALYLAGKLAGPLKAKAPPRKVGAPPPRVISVYNTWTREWLALDADPRGPLPDDATLDRFLRCHFTNQPTEMDARLARTLRDAARHFNKLRVDIVSGFRAPKYNLMLRKKGHEVARDSQHTHGNAVDFRLPGIPTKQLEAWARRQRLGGVGLYLQSGFVHMDTGPIRYWDGS